MIALFLRTGNASRELIARFEKKIEATLARVWGEEGVGEMNAVESVHSVHAAAA